ncbi:hypothetical protein [Acidianus sp. HS-5]|uniref:hypothetical protein n=1 Tax=Acidianus sp. HS-5 TaxID=2886040 RepID=UPI001F28CBE8|nr:hypothetical protein [Acidianus sp. HS-5]BDC19363.1 hypothetical protein HS5_22530 [Acidianus sp. HS-5]
MKKINIGIAGSYTIDEIHESSTMYEKPGGSPIYSSLGVYVAGGEPHVYSVKGEDFNFKLPEYIKDDIIFYTKYNLRFEIDLYNGKRTLKLKFPAIKMDFNSIKLKNIDGLILNPVCNEIDLNQVHVNIPLAVDFQGIVRKCVLGNEISYNEIDNIPSNPSYVVAHANIEEVNNGKLNIEKLFNAGFKEIIISYGDEGFEIYTKNGVLKEIMESKGKNEVGNGDFLLGFYFTLRVKGIEISKASKLSKIASQKFSMYGPDLQLLLS